MDICYDEHGNPTWADVVGDGFRVIKVQYINRDGKPFEKRYYGTDDALIDPLKWSEHTKMDWTIVRYAYNENGQVTRTVFLDNNEKPVIASWGDYAGHEEQYENSKLVKTVYLDREGKPYEGKERGYAAITYQYNEKGKLEVREYRNAKDQLTCNADGYAMAAYQYDDHGNVLSVEYKDTAGELTMVEDLGYARVLYEYDRDDQNFFRIAHFDEDGLPVWNSVDGYSWTIRKKDANGEWAEWEYYDENNELRDE